MTTLENIARTYGMSDWYDIPTGKIFALSEVDTTSINSTIEVPVYIDGKLYGIAMMENLWRNENIKRAEEIAEKKRMRPESEYILNANACHSKLYELFAGSEDVHKLIGIRNMDINEVTVLANDGKLYHVMSEEVENHRILTLEAGDDLNETFYIKKTHWQPVVWGRGTDCDITAN